MRSLQRGRHKPHSASRSKCLTPPRTEVALHTQQRQAIQFHSTKLNRFPQHTNAQLCHTTRRNTATRADRQTAHTKLHTTRYIAQVHNSTHRSVDDTRRSTRKPECFALTHNTHISSQKKQNAHIERATHDLQQAGTTCTAQHEKCVN